MNSAADMDHVFQALAHQCRRSILDIVQRSPGISVGKLAGNFDVSRISIMKHLAVLEEADLVISSKEGRVRKLYFNPVPIQLIYDRWTTEYSAYWAESLTRIKYRAETRSRKNKKATK